jgi:hypothetical protein
VKEGQAHAAAGTSPKSNTPESLIVGVGASGALLAGAAIVFITLLGLVSFNVWPAARGGSAVDNVELQAPSSGASHGAGTPVGVAPGQLASTGPSFPAPPKGDASGGGGRGGGDARASGGKRGGGGGGGDARASSGTGGGTEQPPPTATTAVTTPSSDDTVGNGNGNKGNGNGNEGNGNGNKGNGNGNGGGNGSESRTSPSNAGNHTGADKARPSHAVKGGSGVGKGKGGSSSGSGKSQGGGGKGKG